MILLIVFLISSCANRMASRPPSSPQTKPDLNSLFRQFPNQLLINPEPLTNFWFANNVLTGTFAVKNSSIYPCDFAVDLPAPGTPNAIYSRVVSAIYPPSLQAGQVIPILIGLNPALAKAELDKSAALPSIRMLARWDDPQYGLLIIEYEVAVAWDGNTNRISEGFPLAHSCGPDTPIYSGVAPINWDKIDEIENNTDYNVSFFIMGSAPGFATSTCTCTSGPMAQFVNVGPYGVVSREALAKAPITLNTFAQITVCVSSPGVNDLIIPVIIRHH